MKIIEIHRDGNETRYILESRAITPSPTLLPRLFETSNVFVFWRIIFGLALRVYLTGRTRSRCCTTTLTDRRETSGSARSRRAPSEFSASRSFLSPGDSTASPPSFSARVDVWARTIGSRRTKACRSRRERGPSGRIWLEHLSKTLRELLMVAMPGGVINNRGEFPGRLGPINA